MNWVSKKTELYGSKNGRSFVSDFIGIIKKNKYIAFAVIVGICLMLVPIGGKKEASPAPQKSAAAFDLEGQEEKLRQLLMKIDGAGRVQVMLTLKESTCSIYAADEDEKSEGDRKTETVIISNGGGSQSALTVKYIYPEYLGAAIVMEGADNPQVKLCVLDTVSAVTGLQKSKISVIKMKN